MIPHAELLHRHIKIVFISESTPESIADYYAGQQSLYVETALDALDGANLHVRCLVNEEYGGQTQG